jgi:cobalt/nickel transport system permease protein
VAVGRFLSEEGGAAGPIHRLDARAKILGLVALVVVEVTTPARAFWAFGVYALILVFLVGLARLRVRRVLRRLAVVVPFVLLVAIFLPFFHRSGAGSYNLGGLHVSTAGLLVLWNVAAKAVLGVLTVIVLGMTTPFPQMVAALESLHVPRLFVLVLAFMHRYLYLFAEEFRRMRRAAASRNYQARWIGNTPILGQMLGSLFLRSYSRGERVYVAMLSRGYDGSVRLAGPAVFGAAEGAFLGALVAAVVCVRVLAAI